MTPVLWLIIYTGISFSDPSFTMDGNQCFGAREAHSCLHENAGHLHCLPCGDKVRLKSGMQGIFCEGKTKEWDAGYFSVKVRLKSEMQGIFL